MIIWKGWDIGEEVNEGGVAVSKRVSDSITLSAMTNKEVDEAAGSDLRGYLSLDYHSTDVATLSLEASETDLEEMISLRRKLKF